MSSHLASSPTTLSPSPRLAASDPLAPPAAVRHGHDGAAMPPPTAPALAHALRTLNNFDHTMALRDRSVGPRYDSAYSRSNASTAPGSPRM